MKFSAISREGCRAFMKNNIILICILLLLGSCQQEQLLSGTKLKMSPEIQLETQTLDGGEREGRGSKGEFFYLKVYPGQSAADHEKLLANQSFYYEGLFKEYKTPYPGILSNTKGCPPELTGKAQVSDDKNFFKVWAYANKRKVVGECLKKLNQYHFAKFILRCPGSQDTYQLELFLPFEHYETHEAFTLECAP